MVRSKLTTGNKRAKSNPQTTVTAVEDDRLSTLPDSLLVSILSLLPTKTVVSTSVLSPRWQNLWTQITHLSFTGPCTLYEAQHPIFLSELKKFFTTVDNILSKLTSPKLLKFELVLHLYDLDDYESHVGSWVRQVFSRHLEDFTIFLRSCSYRRPLTLPAACIFQSDAIVSLNLCYGLVYDFPDEININLPNLKKLRMYLRDEHRKLFTTLFKSCPLLEDLHLTTSIKEAHVVDIHCPSLKRFECRLECCTTNGEYVIDAPKLENLSVFCYGTWFRCLQIPCGLAKVEFGMWPLGWEHEDDGFFGKASLAFKGISSVRFLKMYSIMFKYVDVEDDYALPVFHNLTKLTINNFSFTRLGGLLAFLSHCPNLEVLVLCMEWKHDGKADKNDGWKVPEFEPLCLLSKLRIIELKGICGVSNHLQFMEYMLRNGSVLEKVLVDFANSWLREARDEEFEFCQKLFTYPRSSLNCEIKFSSRNITAARKGLDHKILDCHSFLQVQ